MRTGNQRLEMLTDTHCHLDPHYFPEGADAVLTRAIEASVTRFVSIGVGRDLGGARRAVELSGSRPDVWATVGVHPHDATILNDDTYAEI